MKVEYEVDFHPVGQGLFSSGTIFYDSKEFLFVYDCGTSSSHTLVKDAIMKLKSMSKNSIDLLAISHFDNDHINGLDILFKEFSVDTLLLPFMNLETRLILAFEEKIGITSKMIRFFLDPVEYITSEYQGKINNIILVPPTKGQVGQFDSGEAINNADLMGNVSPKEPNNGVSIYDLKPNGIIGIKDIFEFIPYNDVSLFSKLSASFVSAIKKEKENIINYAGTPDSHMIAMDKIRDEYDLLFGKTPKKRNQISLFLFAGPIKCKENYLIICKSTNYLCCTTSTHLSTCYKNSLLYTGDGYLDNKKHLKSLTNYLGANRMSRIVCFQVMHHGAKGTWHKGVAKAISPLISVFSSEPHKFSKHPHAEVVKDFLPFIPMQVDSKNDLNIEIVSM